MKKAARVRVVRFEAGSTQSRADALASEEPLEIQVGDAPLAVTMRTPGHDYELAAGFLYGEGLVRERGQVRRIAYCGKAHQFNRVKVTLTGPVVLPQRHSYVTSSCGICGTASLDLVEKAVLTPPEPGRPLTAEWLQGLPAQLRAAQSLFEETGGLHGCALFASEGDLLLAREDVGRHNAVDKLVGRLLLDGRLPARDTVLVLSGRASFELLQKAVMAGIPAVAALGAPSTLAVALAERFGVLLVGFLRPGRFNVYSGSERLVW